MAGGSIGLVIKIAAETRQAVADIHDVDRALEGTGQQTSKTSKLMSGMGAALPVLGAIAVGALAAAGAMVEFGKAAWEDHQEAQKLANVLRTIPGITQDMIDANEEWITQTMFATHVLDTDLRQGISDLILVTDDLTQAQKYATAAADLAIVANVDYDTAVTAVQKALTGKTKALMGLAPQLDANKDGTLSLAEAQAILTDETLKGQAAAAAAADPWTTIKLIWDEIKESLGQWLIPLFERLGRWFSDPVNQKKIQEFIDKIGNLSYELGTRLLPKLEDFLEWLNSPEGQRQMKEWARMARDLANAIATIAEELANVKRKYDLLKNSSPINIPGAGGILGGIFGRSAQGYPAPLGPSAYAAGSARPVTVNFYGTVTDPESTARAIAASERGSTWRNGRPRSLAPAW